MTDDLTAAGKIATSIAKEPAYQALQAPTVIPTVSASDGGPRARTVFITWAHSDEAWSSSRAKAWQTQIADFAATLVELGIDTDIDLFHLDEPVDWTRFGPRGVQAAELTLVVMSQAWAERWSGTNTATVGAGAAAEADTLRGLFTKNQQEWQRRVVVVMFPDVSDIVVPPDLERITRLYVDLEDPDSVEAVIRLVTGQPRFPKPKLGKVPALGPDDTFRGHGGAARDLRLRLMETRRRMRQLKSTHSEAATNELRELAMRESALQGFIDAILKEED
jgi:hypothetical protein